MSDSIFRIGIFFILCTRSSTEMAVAQFPEPTTVTAQIPAQRTVTGRIVLTMQQGQLVAAEKPDLGEVQASEWLKADFDVVNGTKDELVFDKIVSTAIPAFLSRSNKLFPSRAFHSPATGA